ncbi:RDD family protein [Mycolicibacterium litorale]|uniref:RDD family protein n=1 Tax=Mycolicibacterium litorale TaxID=758802 RepID=UPI003CFAE963
MPVKPGGAALECPQCGSGVASNARFCRACGQPLTARIPVARPHHPPVRRSGSRTVTAEPTGAPAPVRSAGGRVRCTSFLLDLAAMISPALPLSTAAAVLGVAEVVYVVVPVAFAAVWLWMQIWQGTTGKTFGKAMLGLRLVRAADHRPPGVAATLLRSLACTATLGSAGLPVLVSAAPRDGWHDRLSGLTVLDVALGANPLGPRQHATLRRSADRGLSQVHSPVPVAAARRR